jgi:hypothetical protein
MLVFRYEYEIFTLVALPNSKEREEIVLVGLKERSLFEV